MYRSRRYPFSMFMQFMLVAWVTVGLAHSARGLFVAQSQVSVPAKESGQLPIRDVSPQYNLEVKDALGKPAPLDSPLQGVPGSAQQKATGSLQTPKTTDELQPNAKLSDFPSEL